MKLEKTTYLIAIALIGLVLYSCANIGRPTGGDKDVNPPVFIKSTPAPNSLRYTKNKIEIEFDEIVQLKDQTTKVVVSPVQKENPIIRAAGRKITIELRDTLKPNTTYSIDFSDAIQDNNEGNPLDNFSFAFCTGDTIDSLQVSGILLNARDLEPMQSVVVGLHSVLDDSAFTSLPFDRIARTNELGQFTLRNLKPGTYRIFALNDADRDYKFARSEDLAFYSELIVPSVKEVSTIDTVFTAKHEIDTTYEATHHYYMPNDIYLSMFNEEYKSLYLLKSERQDARRLSVIFAAPSDTVPSLEILKPTKHSKDWYKLDRSAHNDTLTYWITDTALMAADSIRINMRYLRTDTTSNLSYTNDTINFNLKKLKIKQKKKKDEDTDSVPPVKLLNFTMQGVSTNEVYAPLYFTSDEPIDTINQQAFHLDVKVDTLWQPVPKPVKLSPNGSLLNYRIDYDWEPGSEYRITVDSLAVGSIYGLFNKGISSEFKIKSLEDYANLFFKVNVQDSAFVELLSSADKVVRTVPVIKGQAELFNITPGDYYARIVLDANGNGKWDTGNFAEHRQPEEVYYYPKKLQLKKNWDIEQQWDIYEVPVDKQKPDAIKKNKPKSKKNALDKDKNSDNTDENGDEEESFNNNVYSGNKYSDYQSSNRR